MRFVRRISLVNFDRKGYEAFLKDKMTEAVSEAAKSWLTTVLAIIPTWSRASRATFEALADAVGFHITYGPIRSREDRLTLGLSTGRGGLKITKKSWHFFYETDLRYLAYNDLNKAIYGVAPNVFSKGGIPNTPYRFVEAGQRDFESFADGVRLPSPVAFITPKRLT